MTGEHGEAVTSNRDTWVEQLADLISDHSHAHVCSNRPGGHLCERGCLARTLLNVGPVPAMLAQARAEVVAAVEAVCVQAEQETADMDREAGEPVGTLTPYLGISLVRAAVSGTDHDTTLDTVRAEALRDAADDLYGNERAVGPFFHSLSVASWLRARADRIAPDDTPSGRGGDDAA